MQSGNSNAAGLDNALHRIARQGCCSCLIDEDVGSIGERVDPNAACTIGLQEIVDEEHRPVDEPAAILFEERAEDRNGKKAGQVRIERFEKPVEMSIDEAVVLDGDGERCGDPVRHQGKGAVEKQRAVRWKSTEIRLPGGRARTDERDDTTGPAGERIAWQKVSGRFAAIEDLTAAIDSAPEREAGKPVIGVGAPAAEQQGCRQLDSLAAKRSVRTHPVSHAEIALPLRRMVRVACSLVPTVLRGRCDLSARFAPNSAGREGVGLW